MKKKIFSLILCCLLLSALPGSVVAAEQPVMEAEQESITVAGLNGEDASAAMESFFADAATDGFENYPPEEPTEETTIEDTADQEENSLAVERVPYEETTEPLMEEGITDVSDAPVFFQAAPAENITQQKVTDNIFPSSSQNAFFYYSEITDEETWDTYYVIYRYDIDKRLFEEVAQTPADQNVRDFFYRDDKLYYGWIDFSSEIEGVFTCIDLLSGETSELLRFSLEDEDYFNAVAIDAQGRIYVGYENGALCVYSSNGQKIAGAASNNTIQDIIGIDEHNGNVYFLSNCNWIYWGFDHDMACLKVARLNSNESISFSNDGNYLTIFYQTYFFEHKGCAELFPSGYLADLSTFSGDILYLLDSGKISPENVIESETAITLIDNGVSVSGVNLKNQNATRIAVQTMDSAYDDDTGEDISSTGPRCAVYSSAGTDYLLAVTDPYTVSEYNIQKGVKTGALSAKYPIYKPMIIQDNLVLLEKDGEEAYVEVLSLEAPQSINITGPEDLSVGDVASYLAVFDTDRVKEYKFSSSDQSILSVDADGYASAWSPGTATVTVKTTDGSLKDSIEVTVKMKKRASIKAVATAKQELRNNLGYHDYGTWSSSVNSYLTEIDAATFMIVEENSDESVQVVYLKNGKVSSTRKISKELDYFEGFYAGKDAYYLVFARTNYKESDARIVLRVVKYDKKWNRIDECNIKKVNTYIPVSFGSLRMTENAGILYIHTCHEMYVSSDGRHHQANMTFEITESNMKIKDSFSDVMNLSAGYVSHSLNQFIRVHDGMVYRVDHGDGYPRGIAFTGYPLNGKMSEPTIYKTIVKVDGATGLNYTGISVGGFECSETHALVSYNQDLDDEHSERNILIAAMDFNSGETTVNRITNYKKSDKISCSTPFLVKVTDGHFLLVWSEYNEKTQAETTAYVKLNNQGKKISGIIRKGYYLSDCEPILLSDQSVAWYASNGSKIYLYKVDPFVFEPTSITLEKTSYLYDGKIKKPAAVVKDGTKVLTLNSDYTIAYSNNKKVGEASVTVKGIGKYSGSLTQNFTILPKGTTVSKLTRLSKGVKVKWKKQATQTSGYQIQYSLKKNMKSAKLITVKGAKKTSYKVTKLKAKKRYYVRVRTYRKSGGKVVYSAWSKIKSIKTK